MEHETGHRIVDEALRPLADLAGRPVTEHPQVFERIHGELVEVLGGLGPAGPAGPAGRPERSAQGDQDNRHENP